MDDLETGFHALDGWYFKRTEGGGVRIVAPGTFAGGVHQLVELDPGTWSSIVASVSANGETGTTFDEARAFHMGGPYPHTVDSAESAFDRMQERLHRGPTPETEGC